MYMIFLTENHALWYIKFPWYASWKLGNIKLSQNSVLCIEAVLSGGKHVVDNLYYGVRWFIFLLQISSQKKKTGVIAPKRFVQRLKKQNEIFRSYMHQVDISVWQPQCAFSFGEMILFFIMYFFFGELSLFVNLEYQFSIMISIIIIVIMRRFLIRKWRSLKDWTIQYTYEGSYCLHVLYVEGSLTLNK